MVRKIGRTMRFSRLSAIPLPVAIIAQLLGVEADRLDDFKRWTDAVISVATGPAREDPIGSGMLPHFADLFAYLREAVKRRRREPADDLISLLVDPSQDGVRDQLDVIMFVVLILVAGNETTTNLIGNAAEALIDHPDVLAQVILGGIEATARLRAGAAVTAGGTARLAIDMSKAVFFDAQTHDRI